MARPVSVCHGVLMHKLPVPVRHKVLYGVFSSVREHCVSMDKVRVHPGSKLDRSCEHSLLPHERERKVSIALVLRTCFVRVGKTGNSDKESI